MPSPRHIVRLRPALDALVQEHIRASETACVVFMQEALAAYLADTPPIGTPPRPDSADSVRELQVATAYTADSPGTRGSPHRSVREAGSTHSRRARSGRCEPSASAGAPSKR